MLPILVLDIRGRIARVRVMDCPTCNQAMSFVPANENWWCNPCLSSVKAPAPEGEAAPSVAQMANAAPQRPQNTGSSWFDLTDLFDAGFLGLILLVVGGLLIYTGHYVVGGILVGSVIAAGVLMDS